MHVLAVEIRPYLKLHHIVIKTRAAASNTACSYAESLEINTSPNGYSLFIVAYKYYAFGVYKPLLLKN